MLVPKEARRMGKVLIVGWDSADFSIVDPMLKAGRLPVLSSLIKRGVRGPLESTFNPNSFPGWTSFMTGVNPGVHGVLHPVIARGNTYAPVPVNSTDIRVRTMWDYLSDDGRRMVVINVPVTYPPWPINGSMITSILTPSLQHQWTYPDELAREVLENVGEYILDARHDWRRKRETLEETKRCVDVRKRTALHLMRSKPWDVFCVVFTSLDRIQHCFWGDRDPKHPGHNRADAEEFGDAIERTHEWLDAALGELLEEAGDDVDLFIVSDHGTGPLYHNYRMNLLLSRLGLLVMKEDGVDGGGLRRMASTASTLVNDIIERLKARKATVEEEKGTFHDKLEKHYEGMKRFSDLVDWGGTKAFFTTEMGVRLNIRGREPEGSVEADRRAQLAREVRRMLLGQKDPLSGGPLFKDVFFRENVYSGPETDNAPDLFPVFASPNVRPIRNMAPPRLMSPEMSGAGFHFHHFRNGILVAAGPDVRKGELKGARLMDIAPTLLHLSGIGVPRHMEGRVLDMFRDGSAAFRPPELVDAPSGRTGVDRPASQEEDDMITERLKGLGYI